MKRILMKPAICIFIYLSFILTSCSTYKKVSLTHFEEYNVSGDERENLHYVLKKHKLLYLDNDRRVRINNFGNENRTIYNSQNLLIQDNVVIPIGAVGICINASEDELVLDFGKGVIVPFKVKYEENKASGMIKIDSREFRLEPGKRNSSLYFDSEKIR